MSIQDLGSIGELLAAIATIATLIYLAKQISAFTTQSQSESEREWFNNWHNVVRSWGTDPETARVFRSGITDWHSLKSNDKLLFHTRFSAIIDHTDSLHRMHARGLVSDELHDAQMDVCLGFLRTPGGSQWWEDMGHVFGLYPYIKSIESREVTPITDFASFFLLDTEERSVDA